MEIKKTNKVKPLKKETTNYIPMESSMEKIHNLKKIR